MSQPQDARADAVEGFIAHWSGREGGQERANFPLFLCGLTRLLGLPEPDPAGATHEGNDYVFERAVTRPNGAGGRTGRIDLYRRGSFVLEAKQSRWKGGAKEIAGQSDLFPPETGARDGRPERTWDALMLNAKLQAEEYARALPASHGWPPFILACDVGRFIEVFADFSGQGKNYTQFPDRQGYRIRLDDLREPAIRERLRGIWLDPTSLDPSRRAARATRRIAERLAGVSRRLEATGHDPEIVAHFLMRCIFTMFAEDVGLLPASSFQVLLKECLANPAAFPRLVGDLWAAMDTGSTFAISVRDRVLHFNGDLFRDARVLPLGREEIGELAAAAGHDWREVEPAIFGTLLEQALDPTERRRLGAHYTPRAYVERLVVATVIEPLRADWVNVQEVAERRRAAGDERGAASEVRLFHETLCRTRVLDPACGTGNFLYVALELMKKLEAEVLDALVSLGGQEALAGLGGHTVDPHQFLGIELNPRAARIAELVLWIGYLQQHFRTKGGVPEPPILRAFRNIRQANAVLTWDGAPLPTVVDGRETYPNPRRPDWPDAEFIVGNPPFVGKGAALRDALGSQVEALWAAHHHINRSADLVMYWWDRAAETLTRTGTVLRRFGFVTTNSITQEFSRRVVKKRIETPSPISLVMAIPDHPWTRATPDAAAVRVAMTVVEAGAKEGQLREVASEADVETDAPTIRLSERRGSINADLTIGADMSRVAELRANRGLASNGMLVAGRGFILNRSEAEHLAGGDLSRCLSWLKPYRNGRDLLTGASDKFIIDLFGLDASTARAAIPRGYNLLLERVKPDRDQNNRASYRDKWWLFAEARSELRRALAGLGSYLATTETAKHRVFQRVAASVVPDHMVVAFGTDDAFVLGILSSRIHVAWSLAAGGWLGIGNDPRYSKSRVFDPFPFPDPPPALRAAISAVAEELDSFRKARQAEHPGLTLTGLYNGLEKLKAGTPLDAKEQRIREDGLVLILKELHERLDRLVSDAYGWPADLAGDAILERLVALNRERTAEEARGFVRWLRPDYQVARFAKAIDRQAEVEAGAQVSATLGLAVTRQKPSFPAPAFDQSAAVFAALAATADPIDASAIAARFRQGRRVEPKVAAILASASRIGAVATPDGRVFSLRRIA